ncbi:MAG: 5-bromo-4-chloroindolyl phosphate hydrolysis family protein [Defluviitaleaceae bacterium]|nr:5-bromo-4-chloroindolyl phosphate hydrolysis family protein [Defluviitaleaceae bacterium]
MEKRRIKSHLPYYTVGLVWFVVALVMPVYTLGAWLVATFASVGILILTSIIAPDKVVMVKAKVIPTGVELADKYIQQGKENETKIEQMQLQNTKIGTQARQIAEVLSKIIAFIQKYPQKARNLNSFMDYYLPTTIKLMESYQHLLSQGQSGENISTTKEKIEGIMPTMVKAFENQLDSLFEDKAMDISAEIKVLKDFLGDI